MAEVSANAEWRCFNCNKRLGIFHGRRLHLKFERGIDYVVGLPAISKCRGCKTLNEYQGIAP
jgi:phage FluMu protein Com